MNSIMLLFRYNGDISPTMMLVLLGVVIFSFVGYFLLKYKEEQELKDMEERERIEKERIIKLMDNAITESGLYINDWESLKTKCYHQDLEFVKNVGKRINRVLTFTLKYSSSLNESDLSILIDGGYFIGMTENMVLESMGEPTKIEDEFLKTKTKRTFIYGAKNSGDVLVFEQGKLVRFKDR